MRVVKAERWHHVASAEAPGVDGRPARRCSVCASAQLGSGGDIVMDGASLARYQVVRCGGCGYDLLEPLAVTLAASA
jgi:hypothetical protein